MTRLHSMLAFAFAVLSGVLILSSAGPVSADSFFDVFVDIPSAEMRTPQGQNPTIYPNGIALRNMQVHSTDPYRVQPGVTPPQFIDSFFDIFTELSLDGGQSWGPLNIPHVPVAVEIRESPTLPGSRIFDTEMLSMNISGLPGGVMIRESPTRPSLGQTRSLSVPGGGYMIDSFFDVFTEISLDGGQNWAPSASATHIEGTPEPGTIIMLVGGGLFALLYAWRRKRAA